LPEELTGIALDSLLVSNPSPFGVKSRCPPSLSLAEQIPALIQHDLDPLEPVAVGLIRVAMGLPLEEFVLLSRKLIDVVTDLFVVHGFFSYVCWCRGAIVFSLRNAIVGLNVRRSAFGAVGEASRFASLSTEQTGTVRLLPSKSADADAD
jgi:hypothetical protein